MSAAWFILAVFFFFVLGNIASSLAQIARAWTHWMIQAFPPEEKKSDDQAEA